jgi:hypothetical protein
MCQPTINQPTNQPTYLPTNETNKKKKQQNKQRRHSFKSRLRTNLMKWSWGGWDEMTEICFQSRKKV